MKQKFTFLTKLMLLLCALIAGSGTMWGDEVYYTFTTKANGSNNAYASTYDVTIDELVWNVPGNQYADGGLRIGGKGGSKTTDVSTFDRIITGKSSLDKAITKICFNHGGISNNNCVVNSVKLTVADNSSFTDGVDYVLTPSFSVSTDGSFNFVPTAPATVFAKDSYYKFTINQTITGKTNYYLLVKSIDFYIESDASVCATPTFSPGTGTYATAQNITISCGTDDATIYYTTDGSDPDDSSTEYSAPVSITTSGTVLKAIAYKDGMTESSIASATYTIKPTKPTISAAGATVTITGGDGCTFYYTTDGTAPSSSSTEYTAPFDLLADCTIKAVAYDTYDNKSDVSNSFAFKYMPLSPKNINSGYYEKVTDVSSLENGDAILIVNETANVAMSTTQNTNNRGETDVTISAGAIYSPSAASAQKLVLVKKTETISSVDTDVFYFYTGSGYLYAPSSSSNYLKTETTPDDNNNARATISISSGNSTITFKGTSTRNVMQYNSTSSLFSCYGSASQDAIQIYKEVAHSESVTLNASGYATFASTYALDFSDDSEYSAWQIKGVSGSTITFEQITGKVTAGTGVLLKGTASSSINIPVAASGSNISATNLLTGITSATAVAADTYYGLSGNKFVKVNAGTVPAGKALLPASEVSSARELKFVFEDETTGIKSIDNGQLIMDNGAVYDLQGRKVTKPVKGGLYIVNGKKVIM